MSHKYVINWNEGATSLSRIQFGNLFRYGSLNFQLHDNLNNVKFYCLWKLNTLCSGLKWFSILIPSHAQKAFVALAGEAVQTAFDGPCRYRVRSRGAEDPGSCSHFRCKRSCSFPVTKPHFSRGITPVNHTHLFANADCIYTAGTLVTLFLNALQIWQLW